MESKTKTADLSVRASFALIQGALVAMAYPLLYFILPQQVRLFSPIFLFIVLPVLAYLISLSMNWFLQYMYCGSVNIAKIATASAVTPVATLSLTGLSYGLPFLKGPITQLFTDSPEMDPAEAAFTKDIWGQAFYLFWGAVYGQTIGSGMISACPSS